MKFAAAAALVVLTALAAAAQVGEKITVTVIEVPVTVVDSGGNAMRGLTKANFKLFDQGKERAITSFDTIDLSVKRSMLDPIPTAARRNFMLLFDLSFSTPKSLVRAQEAARNFLKNVQPRDLVGVGTIDVEHGFRLLASFTTDRELVAGAVGKAANFKSADPLQLSNETRVVTLDTALIEDTVGGPAKKASAYQDMAAEAATEMNVQTQRANVQYARRRVEREIDFLGTLAKTLRAVPGRKQLIFLSEGFDPSLISGRDARQAVDTIQENEQVIRGQGYIVDTDTRVGNTRTQSLVSRMAQFFRGSDVVLHALDIQGVRGQTELAKASASGGPGVFAAPSGASFNSNAGLAVLADPTGGIVFKNVNGLSVSFDRVLKAQEFVYVLSFQAPATKLGTFHDLKVKLVDVPGHANVLARAGYYEGGAQTPQERTLSNAEIILNDIAQGDVRVAGLAAAFPMAGANAQVPVILEVDGNDMLKDLKGEKAVTEIYLYAFDSDGLVRDRLYQSIGLDLAKVGQRLRSGGLKYYATLTLPPGKYAVKALVRMPETDRKGFVRADVNVARANDVAVLPAIFVDEHPSAVLVRGISHATSAADPFDLGGQRFIPAVAPHGKFAIFVTNTEASDVTVDPTPKAVKLLGAAKSGGSTALVMQVDDASQPAVDLT
ncbi:MAG TPA: VWA domain-containing protein, partial [Thermoanaerobaculia bacterium]|nr:VWA domain-containing protein [Thermoanaerobaculia bacterium]